MIPQEELYSQLKGLAQNSPFNYSPLGYLTVYNLVNKALRDIGDKPNPVSKKTGDICGKDLALYFKKQLLLRYGPFTMDVLAYWNIKTTHDFGNIIFDLASVKLLGVSENDRITDFDDVYDFIDAFVLPFRVCNSGHPVPPPPPPMP